MRGEFVANFGYGLLELAVGMPTKLGTHFKSRLFIALYIERRQS
jgi:hypothetical protein